MEKYILNLSPKFPTVYDQICKSLQSKMTKYEKEQTTRINVSTRNREQIQPPRVSLNRIMKHIITITLQKAKN